MGTWLENLIGGIIVYIDRRVSVGDFCSFGDHMDTVESIGIRSIQLRARGRGIITVPTASCADTCRVTCSTTERSKPIPRISWPEWPYSSGTWLQA